MLVGKLQHYGIRALAKDWFVSYLSGEIKLLPSAILHRINNIFRGVPQGSVFGQLLFLLYVNDFRNSSNVLYFRLFEDDANLFDAGKSLHDFESALNIELQNVHTWLCSNKLSLNIKNLIM